ncbi:universal stress protein [Actinoplanes missouriensis]|uniref:universal stress protein n=1 Tax=Actinoplanes missouriensis TaxID=1866 RepID=UPI0033E47AE1
MPTSPAPLVIAGVDGSPSSRSAVRVAAGEAAIRGGTLRLVHAFNWLPTPAASGGPAPRQLLSHAAEQAARTAPGLAVTTELTEGEPLRVLLRRSRQAVLAVIGAGDLASRVCLPRDSLALQFTARATVTVMVTPAGPATTGPVVVGLCGGDNAAATLDVAFDMAAHRRTGLVVVHAWADDDDPRDPSVHGLVESHARKHGISARIRLVEGDPIDVMRQASRDAGLVVVGARGRLPHRGSIGSVTQTLLHHSSAPLVVVRGSPEAPGRASCVVGTFAPDPRARSGARWRWTRGETP